VAQKHPLMNLITKTDILAGKISFLPSGFYSKKSGFFENVPFLLSDTVGGYP